MQTKIDMSFAEGLHPGSKVWVYHSDRIFTQDEVQQINTEISTFSTAWASHGQSLKATGKVILDRIIVLMVDESMAGASGCSVDASVAFVKNIALKYEVNLFDRMLITYIYEGQAHTTKLADLSSQIAGKESEVLVFDNLVKTKNDLQEKSILPVKDSWVNRFL